MFLAIGILYLLLCAPVTVRLMLSFNDVQSAARACVSTLFLDADLEGLMVRKAGAVHLKPRKGPEMQLTRQQIGMAKPFLAEIVRAAHWEKMELRMRVGTGDAAATALAAGAVRAAALSVLSLIKNRPPCDLRVEPVFREPCLLIYARCIFFVRAGDIMIAAAKTAVKKMQKEGFKWINIPSKA